jgi:hypothetical protein
VQAAYDIKEKKRHGAGYWVYFFLGGFGIEIVLLPVKLLGRILFGRTRKYEAGARTYAICQDCGYRWEVK